MKREGRRFYRLYFFKNKGKNFSGFGVKNRVEAVFFAFGSIEAAAPFGWLVCVMVFCPVLVYFSSGMLVSRGSPCCFLSVGAAVPMIYCAGRIGGKSLREGVGPG